MGEKRYVVWAFASVIGFLLAVVGGIGRWWYMSKHSMALRGSKTVYCNDDDQKCLDYERKTFVYTTLLVIGFVLLLPLIAVVMLLY